MTRWPQLLPWHFGGDPWLSYAEAAGLVDAMAEEQRERSRGAAKAKAKKIPGGRSRRR